MNSEGSENELSPLWQQIVEAANNGDGMTEMGNGGDSELVKLIVLNAIYCWVLFDQQVVSNLT